MTENKQLKKAVYQAFGKKVYLLGEDSEGTRYYLESASWDCGWYWGFGYIESYTNNKHPDLARDVESHSHADNFYSEWWGGEDSKLVNTTFTESEGWELAELFKQFYTLRDSAEMFGRGGCHISTSKATKDIIKDEKLAERINKEMLPKVFERIYQILEPNK